MPVVVDDATHGCAWSRTLWLPERHRLTVHDAAYLELAHRLDATLLTLDTELAPAAAKEIVVVETA